MSHYTPGSPSYLARQSARYEMVRTLNPRQFSDIYRKNLETGIPFDTLIDEMVDDLISSHKKEKRNA